MTAPFFLRLELVMKLKGKAKETYSRATQQVPATGIASSLAGCRRRQLC